jgi:hypothetical protein
MRRNTIRTTVLAAIIAAGGAGFGTGCANKTEGDQTLEKASRIEDAGMRIKRGEQMIVDGKATQARGQAMKDQGQTVDGEKLISEGKSMQKQGQALIDQGRQDKM